jgi:hypothetical protein
MKTVTLICMAIFFTNITNAFCADSPKIPSLTETPYAKCDWTSVYITLGYEIINQQGDPTQSNVSHKRMNELRTLISKVKDEKKSVFSQLSPTDQKRYTQITTEQNLITAATILENNRTRHLDVMDHLIKLADKEYRWYDTFVADDNPDKVYSDFISVLPLLINQGKDSDINAPVNAICTADVALYRLEIEARDKIDNMCKTENCANVETVLKEMTQRYNVQRIDTTKLSPADKATFDDINKRVIFPIQHEQRFINQMEAIRLLNAASELMYQTGRDDLKSGDLAKVGSTLKSKLDNNQLDQHLVMAIGSWNIVQQKIKTKWPIDPVYLH